MVVWGGFVVLTLICTCSLLYQYYKKYYISLDSQRGVICHDINYVNISNEIKACTEQEFKN